MCDACRSHKGRVALVVVVCVLAIVVVIGGIVAKRHFDQQQWVRGVVYSKEADRVYKSEIRSFDPKAFSKEGVIHSYRVKDGDFAWTSSHAISVIITINNNPDLTLQTMLEKNLDEDGREGPLEGGVMSPSIKLYDLLLKAYPHMNDDSKAGGSDYSAVANEELNDD